MKWTAICLARQFGMPVAAAPEDEERADAADRLAREVRAVAAEGGEVEAWLRKWAAEQRSAKDGAADPPGHRGSAG